METVDFDARDFRFPPSGRPALIGFIVHLKKPRSAGVASADKTIIFVDDSKDMTIDRNSLASQIKGTVLVEGMKGTICRLRGGLRMPKRKLGMLSS
jgi:hypothetical protein